MKESDLLNNDDITKIKNQIDTVLTKLKNKDKDKEIPFEEQKFYITSLCDFIDGKGDLSNLSNKDVLQQYLQKNKQSIKEIFSKLKIENGEEEEHIKRLSRCIEKLDHFNDNMLIVDKENIDDEGCNFFGCLNFCQNKNKKHKEEEEEKILIYEKDDSININGDDGNHLSTQFSLKDWLLHPINSLQLYTFARVYNNMVDFLNQRISLIREVYTKYVNKHFNNNESIINDPNVTQNNSEINHQ